MASLETLRNIYNSLRNSKLLLGSDKANPMITKRAGVSAKDASLLVIKNKVISDTETIICSIKNTSGNARKISLSTFTLLNIGAKEISVAIYLNGLSGGTFNLWETGKLGEVATDGTLNLTTSTVSGIAKIHEQIGSTEVKKDSSIRINLNDGDVQIEAENNDIITITAKTLSSTTNINFNLRWRES